MHEIEILALSVYRINVCYAASRKHTCIRTLVARRLYAAIINGTLSSQENCSFFLNATHARTYASTRDIHSYFIDLDRTSFVISLLYHVVVFFWADQLPRGIPLHVYFPFSSKSIFASYPRIFLFLQWVKRFLIIRNRAETPSNKCERTSFEYFFITCSKRFELSGNFTFPSRGILNKNSRCERNIY